MTMTQEEAVAAELWASVQAIFRITDLPFALAVSEDGYSPLYVCRMWADVSAYPMGAMIIEADTRADLIDAILTAINDGPTQLELF